MDNYTTERAQRASGFFRRIAEKSENERSAGRPADLSPRFPHAYISSQPLNPFTCSLFCTVASSILPSIRLFRCMWVTLPYCTCHVQKRRSVSFCSNFGNYIYWADCAEASHSCRHPPGYVFPRATAGVKLHVRTCKGRSQISSTAEPFKFGTLIGTG